MAITESAIIISTVSYKVMEKIDKWLNLRIYEVTNLKKYSAQHSCEAESQKIHSYYAQSLENVKLFSTSDGWFVLFKK